MRFTQFLPALLLPLGLLTLASGCNANEKLDSLFGTAGAQAAVAKPKKVTAYRLADNSFYQPMVADYKTTAGPVEVDDDVAIQASKLLLDVDSYLWDAAKGCEPIFGVRLNFVQGDESTDVLFCFECDILTVYHQGKPIGGEDFDKIRPKLVEIVKKIFADDQAIQRLKPER